MLTIVFKYWLDVALFAGLTLVGIWVVHRWLRRGGNGGLPRRAWWAAVAIIAVAAIGADRAGESARHRLRERLEGVAPTYAQELELMGHAAIGFDASPAAPEYLRIIDAEKRWQRANPGVADIYTYRRQPDGTVAFVVDSETDYDRNGRFDGDREQRTAIGEPYPQATANFIKALDGVAGFDGVPYTDRWGTWISAYVPLRDNAGRVEAALGVDYDARLWNQDILFSRTAALGIAGVLLATFVGATAAVTVSRSELAKRTALQRQLVDASRQAGMAEVATGVLHNVGNVLNSVNVSAGVLAEKVRGSKLSGFGRAAGMIREHRTDFADFVTQDAKGKLLPEYLLKLSDLLAGEQQDWLGELASLSRNLDHVKQVVASQQTLAKKVNIDESFDLADLCEDAIGMNGPAIGEHGINVRRAFAKCPMMQTDRHAVLQILVNLIGNATKAMETSPTKTLTVSVETAVDADGTPVARVSVSDTGVGMDAGVLGNLFTHGFTTRKDGHGFGLHHSANAAHVMNGRIAAVSDGPGRGATFTLTLPVSQKGILCQTA